MVPESLGELYRQHIAKQFVLFTSYLQEAGYESLVISAGDIKYHFRDDGEYPFKLNPYFAQWINLQAGAGSYLVIDVNRSQPVLYYYFPDDIWHKPSAIDNDIVNACFDIINFSDPKIFKQDISSKKNVAYIGEQDPSSLIAQCDVNPLLLLNFIDYQRAYKSEYEQACIKLANEWAAIGHKAAAECFYAGKTEYQIQLAYLAATHQLDNEQPYDSIIALNEHAAVLHYPSKSKQAPAEHLSFLIDAGVCVGGYASDISRTYSQCDEGFAALIDAMDEIQQALVAAIKPGMNYLDLHQLAHQKIARLLIDSEIAKGDIDALQALGITSLFFPHGLGHYLGVQVHDKGGWLVSSQGDELKPPSEHPYLRLTRVVEPEQVFTVEPGFYFIDALLQKAKSDNRRTMINWQLVDRFKPYGGIRIEDNILVKGSGVVNLTRVAGLS